MITLLIALSAFELRCQRGLRQRAIHALGGVDLHLGLQLPSPAHSSISKSASGKARSLRRLRQTNCARLGLSTKADKRATRRIERV